MKNIKNIKIVSILVVVLIKLKVISMYSIEKYLRKCLYHIINQISKVFIIICLFFITSCDTINAPDINTNIYIPKDNIPLMAIYVRNNINDKPITVEVIGKTSDMSISHTYPTGYGREFPILGLYPGYKNKVIVKDGNATIVKYIETLTLDIPIANIKIDELERGDIFNQDVYFIGVDNTFFCAYDRKGDIRYCSINEDSTYWPFRVLYDKNISVNNVITLGKTGVMTLSGKQIVAFKPSHLTIHHDVIETRSGKYIGLANSQFGIEDIVIEMESTGKEVRRELIGDLFRKAISKTVTITDTSIKNIVYDDRNPYISTNGNKYMIDWAHANSVVYNEDKDILYISLQRQGIVAVAYSDWELIWFMAGDNLKEISTGANNYQNPNDYFYIDVPLLKDVRELNNYRVRNDASVDGPLNQHALFLHKNENLSMFDNQGFFNNANVQDGSRYVEYNIRGSYGNWQANKVREYRVSGLQSPITSDVDFVGNNNENLLIFYGTLRKAQEVDINNGNKILFDMEIYSDGIIKDGASSYRIDKMPLYPYANENKKYQLDYNVIDKR